MENPEITITAEIKTSMEAVGLLCASKGIDTTLPLPDMIGLLHAELKKNLVEIAVTPIQNFIANKALAKANEQINQIKASVEENISVTIQ